MSVGIKIVYNYEGMDDRYAGCALKPPKMSKTPTLTGAFPQTSKIFQCLVFEEKKCLHHTHSHKDLVGCPRAPRPSSNLQKGRKGFIGNAGEA